MGQKGYRETQKGMQDRLDWYETLRSQAQDIVAKPALYGAEVDIDMDGLKEVVTRSGVNIVSDTAGLRFLYEAETPQEVVTSTISLYGEKMEITVDCESDSSSVSKTIPTREHAAFIANFVKTMKLTDPI